ncbi:MAG: UDP-3-O-acyl-N-acetylglucosamine deacetylase [Candidatus Comchoanobacterales bacterium]
MSDIKQKTLQSSVRFQGVGLHSGCHVNMEVHPAPEDNGIVFIVNNTKIPVKNEFVVRTQLCTVLGCKDAEVATVEHFLAACYGLGLTNLNISIDGSEVPILDGSAAPFFFAMKSAGVLTQEGLVPVLSCNQPLYIGNDDSFISYQPDDKLSITYHLTYKHPIFENNTTYYYEHGVTHFERLVRARTFGFLKDLDVLKENGFAKGASANNAVGYTSTGLMEGSSLRCINESVRHKVLDFLGDFVTLGQRLTGRFVAKASGHSLNQKMVAQLFDLA